MRPRQCSVQSRHTRVGVDRAGGLGPVAVLDLEGAALLLARRRRGRVVGVLSLAAVAIRRRDPEISRPGVEVDGEVLAGRSDRNSTGPLLVVLLVVEGLSLALLEPSREDGELRDARAGVETVETNVLLHVEQVLAVLASRRNALQQATSVEMKGLGDTHFCTLIFCRMAASRSKEPSALVRELRF